MARDLKNDKRKLDQALQNSLANWCDFLVANGEGWLKQALAEKERADKYEIILRELTTAAENYISEDGPVTWDDFIRQFDALEAGIAKAKEALGDEQNTSLD